MKTRNDETSPQKVPLKKTIVKKTPAKPSVCKTIVCLLCNPTIGSTQKPHYDRCQAGEDHSLPKSTDAQTGFGDTAKQRLYLKQPLSSTSSSVLKQSQNGLSTKSKRPTCLLLTSINREGILFKIQDSWNARHSFKARCSWRR